MRVGCIAVAVFCIAACDNDLDIQTAYPFHVETMPVPLRVLKANDRYPLLTDDFRLYYTSASSDSHSFIVVIEDNHGQSLQLDFKFNNDNDEEETATTEKGGQGIESRQ